MPKKKTKKPPVEPGSIDELARIALLLLKYQGAPQGAIVHDLSDANLAPARIAELMGTSPNTVSQQKFRKRPDWPVT